MTVQQKEALWDSFQQKECLSAKQLEQFKHYEQILSEWNKRINLTRITDVADIVQYHFQDSLSLGSCIDMSNVKSVADIGSGAGFPGIPLAIKYPELHVVCIEVLGKRIEFLKTVIEELNLKHVSLYQLDWRTFLRQAPCEVDFFLARASLSIQELVRMFKPASPYKHATLVYWASDQWNLEKKFKLLFFRECSYIVGEKKRRLIFFCSTLAK